MPEIFFAAEKSPIAQKANQQQNELSLLSLKNVEDVVQKNFFSIDRNEDNKLSDLEIEAFGRNQVKGSIESRVASFVRDNQKEICTLIPFHSDNKWRPQNVTPQTGIPESHFALMGELGTQGYGQRVLGCTISGALGLGGAAFFVSGVGAIALREGLRLSIPKPVLLSGVAAAALGAAYLGARIGNQQGTQYYVERQTTVNELTRRLHKY